MRGSLLFIPAVFFHFKFYEAVSCKFSYNCAQDGTKNVTLILEIKEDLRTQRNGLSVHWYGSENASPEGAKMVLDVKWFHDSTPHFVCALHLANMSECLLSNGGTVVQATIRHPSSALEGKYKVQKVGHEEDRAICYLNISLLNNLENCTEIDSSRPSTKNIFIILGCVGGVGVIAGVIVYCCLRKRRYLIQSCLAHCCPSKQVIENLNGGVDTSKHPPVKDTITKFEEFKAANNSATPQLVKPAINIEVGDTPGDVGTAAVGNKLEMLSLSSNDHLAEVEMTQKDNGPPGGQGCEGTRDRETVVEISMADNDQEAGDEGDLCQQEEGEEEVRGEGKEKHRLAVCEHNDNDNELGDVKESESCQALLRSDEEVNQTELSTLL